MKVKRMIKSDVDTFKVGDIIKVKLTDGVKVQAMAMQQEEDGMIFCLVDCLPGEYPMNSTRTNEGGYEESDLRKKLNGEILNLFPAELTDMMAPFDNGDLLRLPTEKEIFGENYYGEYESPYVKQWKPMKKRRNRMAFDGSKEENLQWYWLMNNARLDFLQRKDKRDWWQMIQMLPTCYNQKRTVQLNYAVLKNMYHSRQNHKLDEWREFCKWVETLPYSQLITG